MRGAALLALALAGLAPRPAAGAATNAAPDRVVSRFRLGPFFEYRATSGGGTYWALRPLFSRVDDPVADTCVTDLAWPLGTCHRDREQAWWRLGLAYGSDQDVGRADSAWSAALLPVYAQGRTREGEDYASLFPLYGRAPHVLLMEDIRFVLFPLYLSYSVNGSGREYVLWPVFSRAEAEPGVRRTGVFPLVGRTRREDASHLYAFWPFWTSAVYDGPRNPGASWMLFPLAARVDRAKERQWMLFPPFFSHAVTDSAERWRAPWPFYESVTTREKTTRSLWPLAGSSEGDGESRRYAAWPLYERFTRSGDGRRVERTRLFPLYVNESVYDVAGDGSERLRERYVRAWPLGAYVRDERGSRLRLLEFSLIRASGGIERNWAPFWTLYERARGGGEVSHDALWGLLQYRRAAPEEGGAP